MLYEERNNLSEKTQDVNRAINSLNEEMEAINAYNQRADSCSDDNLKKILKHNADEEREHAAMIIEWLRQNDETFAGEIKDYLFSQETDLTSKHDN